MSTGLLKAQCGLRDPAKAAYTRITQYCKAIEAVGRNMDNAHEITLCIGTCAAIQMAFQLAPALHREVANPPFVTEFKTGDP